jgi:hypothetical protein
MTGGNQFGRARLGRDAPFEPGLLGAVGPGPSALPWHRRHPHIGRLLLGLSSASHDHIAAFKDR